MGLLCGCFRRRQAGYYLGVGFALLSLLGLDFIGVCFYISKLGADCAGGFEPESCFYGHCFILSAVLPHHTISYYGQFHGGREERIRPAVTIQGFVDIMLYDYLLRVRLRAAALSYDSAAPCL